MDYQTMMNRRLFMQLTAAASTAAVLPAACAAPDAKPLRLIVDADTLNEIDDALALTRPELAKAATLDTPPENRRRPINV